MSQIHGDITASENGSADNDLNSCFILPILESEEKNTTGLLLLMTHQFKLSAGG